MDMSVLVKGVVAEQLGIEVEDIRTLDFHIMDDGGADSLDVVEMLIAYEEELNIEISDEDSDKFFGGTVGELSNYLEGRMREN